MVAAYNPLQVMIITENKPVAISGSGFSTHIGKNFTYPRPWLYGDSVKSQSKASRIMRYLESKGFALMRNGFHVGSRSVRLTLPGCFWTMNYNEDYAWSAAVFSGMPSNV